MLASCVVTYFQASIGGASRLLIAVGAGTGSVFILRWFWWRIDAWSQGSAMSASFVFSLALQPVYKFNTDEPRDFTCPLLTTVACSTLASATHRCHRAPH